MVWLPNLLRPIRPDEWHFPYEFKTNRELIAFGNSMLRPHPSKAVEIYMICDVVQCLITFCACAYTLAKKGRMRNIRLFALRKSPYGTFIVPNAVCVLLTGVSVYLLMWAGFCIWIVWVQKSDHPLFEWLWFIPFPWLPLALIAFYSAYGFVISCSPRSPITNLNGKKQNGDSAELGKLSWIYLPLPRSALLMNSFMVGVGVIMIVFNTVVQSLSGALRSRTHSKGHNFYADVLKKDFPQEWLDQAPTKELLAFLHVAWTDGLNIYRYCCLALSSYMAIIVITLFLLIFYSLPNQIFLMNHLCRIYPDNVPDNCQGDSFRANMRLLWRIGWPRKLQGNSYAAFKRTWMMTMVGHSQAVLLVAGVIAFAVPPYYLFFVPWSNAFEGKSSDHQVMFIVAYTISVAFLSAGWVTGLAATLTFDDIFRVVSGLGGRQTEEDLSTESQNSSLPKHTRSIFHKFPQPRLVRLHRSTTAATSPRGSSHSPMAFQTPRPLRPMASFTPNDKSETGSDDYPYEENGNTVLVVTETTITVEHEDLEKSIPMHPYATAPAPKSSPYTFLSRSRKEEDNS